MKVNKKLNKGSVFNQVDAPSGHASVRQLLYFHPVKE
jgi:hypothetical protein